MYDVHFSWEVVMVFTLFAFSANNFSFWCSTGGSEGGTHRKHTESTHTGERPMAPGPGQELTSNIFVWVYHTRRQTEISFVFGFTEFICVLVFTSLFFRPQNIRHQGFVFLVQQNKHAPKLFFAAVVRKRLSTSVLCAFMSKPLS